MRGCGVYMIYVTLQKRDQFYWVTRIFVVGFISAILWGAYEIGRLTVINARINQQSACLNQGGINVYPPK